ncbi:MAG TPA: hypothetical protein VJ974_02915 [Geopsychrobacteraceae bacterium]|nr:hypothetical protein [Geopsychrobacteraceae bacterium]
MNRYLLKKGLIKYHVEEIEDSDMPCDPSQYKRLGTARYPGVAP